MNDNLRKAEKEYFIYMFGEEEARRIEAMPPIKKAKRTSEGYPEREKWKMNRAINEKRIKMEKELTSKFKAKASDSFNTKWKLFLFDYVVYKKDSEDLSLSSFRVFRISNNLINLYTTEYWQKDKEDFINEDLKIKVDVIYKTLKILNESQKELNKDCRTDYINNYEELIFNKEDFKKLLSQESCGYCGMTREKVDQLFEKKMLYKKNERGWNLEIDRKNSNLEYTKDNCVMCCYWCNNAKTDEFTYSEFKEIGLAFKQVWDKRLK